MKRSLVLLAVLLAAAGCGKADVPTGGPVTVTVSQDFGSARVLPTGRETAKKDETVLSLMERSFDVTPGGSGVQEIGGVSGGQDGGKPVDWFYYVNGVAVDENAAERKLYPGDDVWWDRHFKVHVPAVVGAFPEPFRSGLNGKKFPIRLVCMGSEDRSCDEVETRLQDAGIKDLARSNLESSPGQVLRILVGKWTDVRKDIAARTLEQGPATSGVFAKPDAAGTKFDLLDAEGATVRSLGPGSGLIAATQLPSHSDEEKEQERPTWIVTGTDDVGVAAAAAAMNEEQLANRFALAIESGRGVALPLNTP
jgi:hypothetical protein